MNNIGVGIFCFGEGYYFNGTKEKIEQFTKQNIPVYVLTNEPDRFTNVNIVEYVKEFKSYHDKMILPKYILKNHDYCLLLDADTHVTDYSFLDVLKTYNFKDGISYVDTLLNHSARREYVKDLLTNNPEWSSYKSYAEKIYPTYGDFETMWEYFLIINKNGFNQKEFYQHYEKLQVVKDFCDVPLNKSINGAGEGISISISSRLSNTSLQRDMDLYEIIKNKMVSVSRRHTPPHLWPNWMK